MLELMITLAQSWIGAHGFLGVFGASLLEELVSVIPSSIVQGAAGTILFLGVPFSLATFFEFLWKVSFASALGVSLGSLPYVWASRFFGLRIIDRYGSWIGVSHEDINKLEARLQNSRYDEIIFTLLRAVPLFPSIAFAVYGGIVEMNIVKYMLLSFVGVFIRATALGLVGWLVGNTVSGGIDVLEKIGIIMIVVCTVFWVFLHKRKKTKTIPSRGL